MNIGTQAIEKIKILEAVLELPAKQHSQFGQFGPFLGILAALAVLSSWKFQNSPKDFDFLIAIGANYSFELNSIGT